eukprot:CAMPEP_0114273418 /NCGR_PEP_ID=MMETSP0058-20121206/29098_1 /TAXON_ID=36894 /ORGANISM="Pyramimonas parkeae, CCMP726" /LENGTH=112 /DNA_ID=CAMNT_0001392895 /DNA_START=36 /DNA_END=374 /DNA_ORIENTATION=-
MPTSSSNRLPRCQLPMLPKHCHQYEGPKLCKARFSWVTEPGDMEKRIVASYGKFSVMWNFRVVKSIIQAGVPAPSLNVSARSYDISSVSLTVFQSTESLFLMCLDGGCENRG